MAQSIIQTERECYLCGRTDDLHEHHCLEGAYRGNKKNLYGAEKYGLTVWLCPRCHRETHASESRMAFFRKIAQTTAMRHYGWDEWEFIKRIGRSFL